MTIDQLVDQQDAAFDIADTAADFGDFQTANNAAREGERLGDLIEEFFNTLEGQVWMTSQ